MLERVLDRDGQRQLDAAFSKYTGLPTLVLMEQAAMALFQRIQRIPGREKGRIISIFCGPGNNGGDGYALARYLLSEGILHRVYEGSTKKEARGDAGDQREAYLRLGGKIQGWEDYVPEPGLLVDALLGTGYHVREGGRAEREVDELLERWTEAKRMGAKLLAVDLPSGLDANTGRLGLAHPGAEWTVSFGTLKPGFYYGEGPLCCGKIELAALTFPPSLFENLFPSSPGGLAYVPGTEEIFSFLPPRPQGGHKGSFGQAGILAGDDGMAGAGLLATRAALLSGTGRVYAQLGKEGEKAALLAFPSAILSHRRTEGEEELLRKADQGFLKGLGQRQMACLIGPGLQLTERNRHLLQTCIEHFEGPLVIDAGALRLLPPLRSFLQERKEKSRLTLLTPHVGEYHFLATAAQVKEEAEPGLRLVAKHYASTLLYKSAVSVVVDEQEGVRYLPGHCAALGRGGSGDMLAGLLVGFLAQGRSPLEAACLATVLGLEAARCYSARAGTRDFTPEKEGEEILKIMGEIEKRQRGV